MMKMRRLTLTYILALCLIALLSISAFTIQYSIIKTQENSASIINISGRQRMLSQRAALLASDLVYNQIPAEHELIKSKLLAVLQELEQAHLLLTQGKMDTQEPHNLSEILQNIYFADPYQLDKQLTTFINEARALADLPLTELNPHNAYYLNLKKSAYEQLINTLNIAVQEYQLENEVQISRLQRVEQSVLALTLLILLGEALFIFRPLFTRIKKDTLQLEEQNIELQRLTMLDGLTRIANRRRFDLHLDSELKRAQRLQSPLALVMLDIDNFKKYNDTYGHQGGDECLKAVAACLEQTINRPSDLAARFGGEEFALILPDTPLDGAITIAEKVRQAVEELRIPHRTSQVSPWVTVSGGLAVLLPDETATPQLLISQADAALYESKNNGRNRISY